MSTLTKQERDALEDVFLSIDTSGSRYKKHISFKLSKLLFKVKIGLKNNKNTIFFNFFTKKKKNLSK